MVCWRYEAWRNIDYGLSCIKQRYVTVKIFEYHEIAGHLLLVQYKNSTGGWLDVSEFFSLMDAASDHAMCVGEAVNFMGSQLLMDRDDLAPKEIVTELAMLNISQSQKGSLIWSDSIHALFDHLKSKTLASIFVLKAQPLEFMWASNEAHRSKFRDDNVINTYGLDTAPGLDRMNRRTLALSKLYERHLGFETLYPGREGIWMGRCYDEY